MTKRVFIVTGEHSGEMHAAKVVEHLRAMASDIEVEAKEFMSFNDEKISKTFSIAE